MIGYEEYLQKYPQVARRRADSMLSGSICYFFENNTAVMQENTTSDNYAVVNIRSLTCTCNVFRNKKACPHVAAVLGRIEKNDGKIPYTDLLSTVYNSLERLKEHAGREDRYVSSFCWNIRPLMEKISFAEKEKYLLQLALYYQSPECGMSPDAFLQCYDAIRYCMRDSEKLANLVYQNRKDCLDAFVLIAVHRGFSSHVMEAFCKELSADDVLTEKYLPELANEYTSYFTRNQLINYYETKVKKDPRNYGIDVNKLLNRLVLEEPPLYDDFFEIFNSSKVAQLILKDEAIDRLLQAGYGDRSEAFLEYLIESIRNIGHYEKIIRYVPHDQFLSAWRKCQDKGYFAWGWRRALKCEISFREDPDEHVDNYNLDDLEDHTLEVILRYRPEFSKEINMNVRKRYRAAVKARRKEAALKALMMLVLGKDTIAARYAAEWEFGWGNGDDRVYETIVGTQFDCLERLAPDMKKLEVSHAAGQD